MTRLPRIALISREAAPFGGGGIAEYIGTIAPLLATRGEVTIFTTSLHAARYDLVRDSGWRPYARFVFVDEPSIEEIGGFYSHLHRYSARVWDALRREYGESPPALIEFSDYLGEGFVTTQAKDAGDPWLEDTTIAVRLHSSAEICTVLDGHLDTAFEARCTVEQERFVLQHADVLIPPGPATLETYREFYGAAGLAQARCIRYPVSYPTDQPSEAVSRDANEPLRLLYLGRLERRKGVHLLVQALQGLERDDWALTLLGGDTDTGPLGSSMREVLQETTVGDARFRFSDYVPPHELAAFIDDHDIVVLPSLWENWPYVALQALARNRPVVATPTGGFGEIVRPGVTGWLTRSVDVPGLAHTLAGILARRDLLAEMTGDGRITAALRELTDEDTILTAYDELIDTAPSRPARRPPDMSRPLVSAIVPYYRMAEFVEETVCSLLEQTYPSVEIIVVNDGSFEDEDRILGELSRRYPIFVLTRPNGGLGAARNAGIRQSRGKYFFPLDADNVAHPTFIERCVEVLESRPDRAFVTSWSQYIDERGAVVEPPNEGYQPFGNWSSLIERDNVAGDAAAVLRRSVFDRGFQYDEELTSFEDWFLYRALHEAGRFGVVIPERLIRYRIRQNSMIRETGIPNMGRLANEMMARTIERTMSWTCKSA